MIKYCLTDTYNFDNRNKPAPIVAKRIPIVPNRPQTYPNRRQTYPNRDQTYPMQNVTSPTRFSAADHYGLWNEGRGTQEKFQKTHEMR